ncbi:TetR-like C-terminal domain-containing protein [Frigoribacterium sp. RIT-PI-h]|uniref:TetR-like C-terminal domain-containing protein n=1 Tax=Frigoribacterium sp. RIT-PI-h TaxID=1690245 RepID=UPI001F17F004|nr:TetR-like C-terminal domain-containing protein [Frigoribacterium sp. RIT-PI-h]
MAAVAARVGVRAPSLYKRVENREALLRAGAEAPLPGLAARHAGAGSARELLDAFRAFGHERPAAFQLVMTPGPGVPTARREFGAAASAAALRVGEELVGPAHALDAARTLTAWVAGFVIMELNGGFQLGGDVGGAWAFGAGRILAARAAPPRD